jgi:hypothetical protein
MVCSASTVSGTVGAEDFMVQISPIGLRNEYWRRRLLLSGSTPPRYGRIFLTPGVHEHPGLVEIVFRLLSCPVQMSEDINPHGDCDLLKLVVEGKVFYLKVNCCASDGDRKLGSDDPADDEKTTRVFTCMLASEYSGEEYNN